MMIRPQPSESSAMETIRTLIVEDETIPAHYLQGIIEEDPAFRVERIVADAAAAWEAIGELHPEIIFMDIMIEGVLSGAELALKIHAGHPEILIIFMTAYSNEEMMDYAVDAEAFAYLLKPYRPREIHATLKLARARLRKAAPKKRPGVIPLVHGYACDLEEQRLMKEGSEVPLAPREKQLIFLLCSEADRIVSRESILEQMEINDSALRSLIYRLRKMTDERLIISEKRYGYRIATAGSG